MWHIDAWGAGGVHIIRWAASKVADTVSPERRASGANVVVRCKARNGKLSLACAR
tara:strand:- start:890 stop:1054 length:165 start_codon:yes stop_codon:yes gene_type:complete